MYLESLRHTCSSCAVSFAVPFDFIRFMISALCPVCVVFGPQASLEELDSARAESNGFLKLVHTEKNVQVRN